MDSKKPVELRDVVEVVPLVSPVYYDATTSIGREQIGAILLNRAGEAGQLTKKDMDFLLGVKAAGVWGVHQVIAMLELHGTVTVQKTQIAKK